MPGHSEIRDSWAHPSEYLSTPLYAAPRLSIQPYSVEISKPSIENLVKYDFFTNLLAFFVIF